MPICCPRHDKQSSLNVTKVTEFPNYKSWEKFCSLACDTQLRCGHLCQFPCHSPIERPHNNKCNEQLERPCETHALVPLYCHELMLEKNETLTDALRRFNCNIEVDYTRPECLHVVKVKCHEKTGNKVHLDECSEVVSDYYHPICNHVFAKPKCSVKRRYERKEPKCTQKVLHTYPCKCESYMSCYEHIEESHNPSICNRSVEINRPRCGHMLSMRCNQAEKLKLDWQAQRGNTSVDRKFYFVNFQPLRLLKVICNYFV